VLLAQARHDVAPLEGAWYPAEQSSHTQDPTPGDVLENVPGSQAVHAPESWYE